MIKKHFVVLISLHASYKKFPFSFRHSSEIGLVVRCPQCGAYFLPHKLPQNENESIDPRIDCCCGPVYYKLHYISQRLQSYT
jgi:ribosomal protein L32